METQTKWMIGGAVVLAAGGYYWFFVRPKTATAQANQILASAQQGQQPLPQGQQQPQDQGAQPPPQGGRFDPSSILATSRVYNPASFVPVASGPLNNYSGWKANQ